MTTDFNNLLHLLSCTIFLKEPEFDRNYNFKNIYKLSKAHQVQTIIFPTISKYKEKLNVNESLFQVWKKSYLFLLSRSFQRKQYLFSLIKKLDKHNIGYCILKGDALANLYSNPDDRISSDIDLLISDKENVSKVLDFLNEDKFIIKPNLDDSHQIECYHQNYGLIEVHTKVCDETAYKIWFENKIEFEEPFMKTSDNNANEFYTLSVTDGAIFVTFHFLKHFLSHGCGIRQLLDMLLYLKHYEAEIDWNRYNSLFDDLRYLKFIYLCKQIGNLFFNMNFDVDGKPDQQLCESVLSDLENSGVFGKEEEYRNFFTHHFTAKRRVDNKHLKVSYSAKLNRLKGFLRRYNYNIFMACINYFKRCDNQKNNLGLINKRLNLFEDLGIFEKTKKGDTKNV